MKIDLKDTTFIIPIRIDSSDRLRNLFLSVSYLLHNFDTNIIIKESDSISLVERYLPFLLNNKSIKYIYEKNDQPHFHRTRILNDMILESNTKVVVNYDADIILPIDSYFKAKLLIDFGTDLVYPFKHGEFSEKKVLFEQSDKNYLLDTSDLLKHEFYTNNFDNKILDKYSFYSTSGLGTGYANYGMCQFFNRKSYIDGYMENENFISYGPEDKERFNRFKVLGYIISRVENHAYHLEHHRGDNSSNSNPYSEQNQNLWQKLYNLNKKELISYYRNQNYYGRNIK